MMRGRRQHMLTLHIYTQPNFPAIFKWQAIAFMRTEWSDIFQGDNLYMPETYPPDYQPVHFVFARGDTLISYAAIMKVTLNHSEVRIMFMDLAICSPFRLSENRDMVLKF